MLFGRSPVRRRISLEGRFFGSEFRVVVDRSSFAGKELMLAGVLGRGGLGRTPTIYTFCRGVRVRSNHFFFDQGGH